MQIQVIRLRDEQNIAFDVYERSVVSNEVSIFVRCDDTVEKCQNHAS
jgi:hypothetical protein